MLVFSQYFILLGSTLIYFRKINTYRTYRRNRRKIMTRKLNIIQQAINAKIIDSELTAIGVMDFEGLKLTVIDAYEAFSDNFYHTFAVKANALVKVLSQLKCSGMGAEVASPGELLIALSAGFKPEQIIYDSPTKTLSDLRTCIEKGI
ncbi:MAG: diaminopimelate decarboxylase, partial [Enterobacterales bacterium]